MMKELENLRDALTRQEAADLMHVHVSTIDRAMARGDLITVGPPGRVRIEPEELYRWARERNGRKAS
jgi:excisionase family DNA binding protein